MPKVSVVMAVYNGLPYLNDAVESILRQTMTDFEFIIINDASADQTSEILHQFNDPRLRIVDLEKNEGQTACLNRGLKMATAPFVARQDADDRSKPNRLAEQVAFLESNPDYLLLGTAGELIDDRDIITGIDRKPVTDQEVRAVFAGHDNCFFHGSVMFRREVLDKIGLYREGFRNSQDYDMWLRIAEIGKVANLPEPLYQYRLHAGQMTFTSYYRMKAEWKLAQELAEARAAKGDDSAHYEAGARALQDRFSDFVPTPQERRRAMAELWRGKGVAYMNSKKYPQMLYCLFRAFLWEPDNPDFWRGVRNHIPGL
ncbi:MAG: glycosyltransferase [Anaerolineae bacterium]|nr:MAG: glycosyltransferase [Anaerolineae bacterium]